MIALHKIGPVTISVEPVEPGRNLIIRLDAPDRGSIRGTYVGPEVRFGGWPPGIPRDPYRFATDSELHAWLKSAGLGDDGVLAFDQAVAEMWQVRADALARDIEGEK